MGGFPDRPEQPRNSGYHVKLWNRRSGALVSISTARSDPPLKQRHLMTLCLSFIILPSTQARLSACSVSFQRFPDGKQFAGLPCVGIQPRKDNDRGENCKLRDCLAQSETPPTSATVGANPSDFRNGSLCGSGTYFYFSRFVLDHDLELGNRSRWPSCLAPLISTSEYSLSAVNPNC